MRLDAANDAGRIADFQRQAGLSLVGSLRDFWRHIGHVNLLEPVRAELGKRISDGLYKVIEYGVASFEEPVSSKREFTRMCDPERVAALLNELQDPVLKGLWELNTVQAMLDLLAHNGLHMWDPHFLSESTLDYASKYKVCVAPADLDCRGGAFSEFDDTLTRKVAPALGLTHVRGDQYRNQVGTLAFFPLYDTAQAQQLAKKLNIGVTRADSMVMAASIDRPHLLQQELVANYAGDVEAATRRAIVVVAANIADHVADRT
jgi:hypothetical protein